MTGQLLPMQSLDALPPAAMTRKAEQIGVDKARLDVLTMFALAVLAGAFIALGAAFATTTAAARLLSRTGSAAYSPA